MGRPPKPGWGPALVALAVAVLAVHVAAIAHRRASHAGDFDISRELGRRLLAGEPLYAGGLHYPYMPTAALGFAPLALVPPWLGFALRYGTALGCLWFALHRLSSLLGGSWPRLAAERRPVAALALVLAAHYVIRDLDDGGPHLILLALLVGGLGCVARGRPAAGAFWLGLAAALKAPNALLLPFFVWKRQWRVAALSTAALAAWSALPAAWMGPAAWWGHQRQWAATALASALGAPAAGARESEERPQNQALRPAVTRAVRAWLAPPASPLPALAAGLAAFGVLAAVAWRTRGPLPPGDPAWLAEASAVLILSLLLSPVTWVQHLVLLVPALYLIAAVHRARGGLPRAAAAAMFVYAGLSLLLNRELLGRAAYLDLLAGGLHTLCMLLVLAVVLTSVRRVAD